jgi:hypothetical protein
LFCYTLVDVCHICYTLRLLLVFVLLFIAIKYLR